MVQELQHIRSNIEHIALTSSVRFACQIVRNCVARGLLGDLRIRRQWRRKIVISCYTEWFNCADLGSIQV